MGETILLVDDNPHILKINCQALTMCGYCVIEAETLSRARALLEQETPSLVILDIELPDGDGTDFCKELRGSGNIPILLLSSKDKDDVHMEEIKEGNIDFLAKPYRLNTLIDRVETLLGKANNKATTQEAESRQQDTAPEVTGHHTEEPGGGQAQWVPTVVTGVSSRGVAGKSRRRGARAIAGIAAAAAITIGALFALTDGGVINDLSSQPPFVEIEDDNVPLAGMPLLVWAEVDVNDVTLSIECANSSQVLGTAAMDASRMYRFGGIPNGEYHIIALLPENRMGIQSMEIGRLTVVNGSAILEFDAALEDLWGSLIDIIP